jgi:hypothetical protein
VSRTLLASLLLLGHRCYCVSLLLSVGICDVLSRLLLMKTFLLLMLLLLLLAFLLLLLLASLLSLLLASLLLLASIIFPARFLHP